MTFDPQYTRFPFFPLSYDKRRMAVPNEMMLDYIEGEIYIRSEDNTRDILVASSKSMTHLTDFNNPHRVTKQHIGLGLVDDVKQASYDDFEAHINATNPHNISKNTIGLGNVENYPIATLDDILNGRPDRYITPELMHRAIDKFGINIGRTFALIINTIPVVGVTVEVKVGDIWETGNSHFLPVNTYEIRISREGYSTYEDTIVLDNDIILNINLDAVTYDVIFDISPEDAKIEVLVDGAWVEVTEEVEEES